MASSASLFHVYLLGLNQTRRGNIRLDSDRRLGNHFIPVVNELLDDIFLQHQFFQFKALLGKGTGETITGNTKSMK